MSPKVRDERFKCIFKMAHIKGHEAATSTAPTPMVVQQHKNILDDASPVVKSWLVSDGVCGFAWVTIFPGNSSAAIFAKKKLSHDLWSIG